MMHSNIRGKDLHSPSNEWIENHGTMIPKMICVKFTGYGTKLPIAEPINSINDVRRGITLQDIETNKVGLICVIGFMYNMDTSDWTTGTKLYSTNAGQLTNVVVGLPVALVVKSDQNSGILYVDSQGLTIGDLEASINAHAWGLHGNSGTSLSDFIGTTDSKPFILKTNNITRQYIDPDGKIGYGNVIPKLGMHKNLHNASSNSGDLEDTFTFRSDTIDWVNAYSFTMEPSSIAMVQFNVIGKTADLSGLASFRRTATFYSVGSNVYKLGLDQSDYTMANLNGFKVGSITSGNSVIFRVKNHSNIDVSWTGSIKITLGE